MPLPFNLFNLYCSCLGWPSMCWAFFIQPAKHAYCAFNVHCIRRWLLVTTYADHLLRISLRICEIALDIDSWLSPPFRNTLLSTTPYPQTELGLAVNPILTSSPGRASFLPNCIVAYWKKSLTITQSFPVKPVKYGEQSPRPYTRNVNNNNNDNHLLCSATKIAINEVQAGAGLI